MLTPLVAKQLVGKSSLSGPLTLLRSLTQFHYMYYLNDLCSLQLQYQLMFKKMKVSIKT